MLYDRVKPQYFAPLQAYLKGDAGETRARTEHTRLSKQVIGERFPQHRWIAQAVVEIQFLEAAKQHAFAIFAEVKFERTFTRTIPSDKASVSLESNADTADRDAIDDRVALPVLVVDAKIARQPTSR